MARHAEKRWMPSGVMWPKSPLQKAARKEPWRILQIRTFLNLLASPDALRGARGFENRRDSQS